MIPIQASAETRTRCGDSRTNRYADTYDRPRRRGRGSALSIALCGRRVGALANIGTRHRLCPCIDFAQNVQSGPAGALASLAVAQRRQFACSSHGLPDSGAEVRHLQAKLGLGGGHLRNPAGALALFHQRTQIISQCAQHRLLEVLQFHVSIPWMLWHHSAFENRFRHRWSPTGWAPTGSVRGAFVRAMRATKSAASRRICGSAPCARHLCLRLE